eukprot:TRINITY_DN31799_c0_g1_i1.p2 TRINITY_DN31799_c0_g1~~TRINITY_DN31799_c0_g1_i1.p2  ORF type:complete len:133 (-),score=13.96 TRINITY_DN31799_c0_g1_i1:280-678(-)
MADAEGRIESLDGLPALIAAGFDNALQYIHIICFVFLLYEDIVLRTCSIAGGAGLFVSVLGLEFVAGLAPTRGDRLWSIAIPGSGALTGGAWLGCRVAGLSSHLLPAALVLAASAGLTWASVRGDRDARKMA